jgi:hypothetical protein
MRSELHKHKIMIPLEKIMRYHPSLSVSLITHQVYIYFISNQIEDRTSEIQLDLQLPSVRSEYLKIWEFDQNYVEHKVYRKGKLGRRRDYSKENGEVLVRKEIPARRVLARCRFIDLADCHLKWWLDKVAGVSTQGDNILPTYREAMRRLKEEVTEHFLQQDVVISAQNVQSICLSRDGTVSPIPWQTLYYIMIYGLGGKELKEVIDVPFMLSGDSSQTQGIIKDCEVVTTSKRRWCLRKKAELWQMFVRWRGVRVNRSYDKKGNGSILD